MINDYDDTYVTPILAGCDYTNFWNGSGLRNSLQACGYKPFTM